MPPKTDDTPKHVKPYLFHGLDLTEKDQHYVGECPFCGKEKFGVETLTGLYNCFACGGGSVYHFLQRLLDKGLETTDDAEYEELGEDRKIDPKTLRVWNVAQHPCTGDWCLPGYDEKGKLVNLYRYRYDGSRFVLLATSGLHHGLFYLDRKAIKQRENVYLCEGPWDAMSLWEVMVGVKELGGRLVPTASSGNSLLSDATVVAVPGCSSFSDKWGAMFGDKRVHLLYDSDYPNEKTKRSAGYQGAIRVAQVLSKQSELPKQVKYLAWGEEGYDESLPDGYDIRDHLNNGVGKLQALQDVLSKVVTIPDSWVAGRSKQSVASGGVGLEPIECTSWKTLQTAWRKALRWNEGLDRALRAMLACVVSTETPGDQLWIRVIGPPSCGKTTLCEALSVNRQYVFPKDTLTGLSSGYQTDAAGSENLSLAIQIDGKTLVINDGDTLVQMPNRDQVLAQLRAFYGRNLRTTYRNKMSADHEGIDASIIICGTESLRVLDTSELGERTITVTIMDKIDDEEESAISRKSGIQTMRMIRLMSSTADARGDSRDMTEAKRLTGGYVSYLRENAADLFAAMAEDEAKVDEIEALGAFVAYMRSRPSVKQEEKVQRELSTRLTNQVVKLAMCIAVVMNKNRLDASVMETAREIARDTAKGRTLDICKVLYDYDSRGGTTVDIIGIRTGQDKAREQHYIRHLVKIGAVRWVEPPKSKTNLRNVKSHYRLTERMKGLYEVAFGLNRG